MRVLAALSGGVDSAVAAAKAGIAGGAKRVCLVASGRGPSNRDVDKVAEIIGEIKALPGVERLMSLKANKKYKINVQFKLN